MKSIINKSTTSREIVDIGSSIVSNQSDRQLLVHCDRSYVLLLTGSFIFSKKVQYIVLLCLQVMSPYAQLYVHG